MNKIEKLDIIDLMEVKGGMASGITIDAKCLFGGAVRCTVAGTGHITCIQANSGVIVNKPNEPTTPTNPETNTIN